MTMQLKDLGKASIKAKIDLYYNNKTSLSAIVDYDEGPEHLKEKTNGGSSGSVRGSDFIGAWKLLPKATSRLKDKDSGLIAVSLEEEWDCIAGTEAELIHVKESNNGYCFADAIDIFALQQSRPCHNLSREGFRPTLHDCAADLSKGRKVLPKGGT